MHGLFQNCGSKIVSSIAQNILIVGIYLNLGGMLTTMVSSKNSPVPLTIISLVHKLKAWVIVQNMLKFFSKSACKYLQQRGVH